MKYPRMTMWLCFVWLLGHLYYEYCTRVEAGTPNNNPIGLSEQIRRLKRETSWISFNVFTDPDILAAKIDQTFRKVTGQALADNPAYGSLILAIMQNETGFRSRKKALSWLPIPRVFETSHGIMQVRPCDRDNENLLDHSLRRLDQIVKIYSPSRKLDDGIPLFVFADWAAGDYSSAIAAFQSFLNRQTNTGLELDGDLGPLTIIAAKRRDENPIDDLTVTIFDTNERALRSGSHCEAAQAKKAFLESAYFESLAVAYPELRTPIVADAKVRSRFERYLKAVDPWQGWNTSRQFSDQANTIYLGLRKLEQ